MSNTIANYVQHLNRTYRQGDATEHSYRSALENLLHRLGGRHVEAVNEPRRNIDCGAPDFKVKRADTMAARAG